jgi:site-specific DNA-methyltransferase (adenine-specific)
MTSKPGDIYGGGKGLPSYTAVAGYDDAGGGSRMFPAFRYQAKASTRERPRKGDVVHPTVKPVDLMRWLCRLVTPPGGRIFEPFAGSGTTGEAALVEGFEVVMTEREHTYAGLIEKRIRRDLQATLFADMFDGLDDGAAS